MKRYVMASDMKVFNLIDILNDPRGRQLINSIEEAEEEIRGRGIDMNDTSNFWVNARQSDIDALKTEFGFTWR